MGLLVVSCLGLVWVPISGSMLGKGVVTLSVVPSIRGILRKGRGGFDLASGIGWAK